MLGGGEPGLRGGIGWEIMFATVKHHKVTFSHTNTQSHTETQTRSNKHTVTQTIKHTKSQARTHTTQTGRSELWLISGEAIERLNYALQSKPCKMVSSQLPIKI